jgi:netrin-G3 ligand
MVNTSSDKPSGPPLNVALTFQDITTLQLSWSIPNKADRNGDIIRYHVECFGEGIPSGPTSTKSTSTTFSNLQPFTDYGCRVAATTVNGTGPYSMFENRTTPEGVPGPVDTINVTKLNNNRVEVSWGAPNPLNGVIIRYLVKYRIHDSQDDTTLQTTDNSQKIEINGLSQGVPYSLVVIAETRAGLGEESPRKVFFSRELAPTKNVASITGVRVSDSEMMISWTGLTLQEARGFPSYTITYEPVGSTGRVSRQAQTVQTEQTSTTVGGLLSEAEYLVHITVSTDGGSSAASEPVTVPMFQPPPPSGPNTSTESPTSVGVAVAVVLIAVFVVAVAVILVIIAVCYKRNKMFRVRVTMAGSYDVENESLDVSISASKESISKSVSREAPELMSDPLLPPKGEKPEGIICDPSSGQLTERFSPDEDEQLEAEIEKIVPPDIKNEKQYVNLLPAVKASRFSQYYQEMWKNDSFEVEFKGLPLKDFTAQSRVGQSYPEKNRYRAIIPYDHSRVSISGDCDYINASFIAGHDKKVAYIAAQGPMPQTTSDFWQMISDDKIAVVVMLTKVEEKGKIKCVQYWNDEISRPFNLTNGLVVTLLEHQSFADYEARTFSLSMADDSVPPMCVKHFQYTGWPDHGVPLYPGSVLKFVQLVGNHRTGKNPLLVHCSAGVGRSGTFMAIDAMMQRLKEKNDLNIYEYIYSMRCERPFMIQNVEQYIFVHEVLCEYVTCGDTSVKIHGFESSVSRLRGVTNSSITGFDEQFNLLDQLSRFPVKGDNKFAEDHSEANRYSGRAPYQANCLYIQGKNASRFVNASFIDTYSVRKGIIAAQLPLPHTAQDVLRVILQRKCQTVVTICTKEELGDVTICPFWITNNDQEAYFDQCSVRILGKSDKETYCVYRLEVCFDGQHKTESLEFTLIHCYVWPEIGDVKASAIYPVIQCYEKAQKGAKTPSLIMCNDGMGRTGVFINIVSEMERIKMEGRVDVFQNVKATRHQRPYMVPTVEQYILIHEVLECYVQTFQPYANFRQDLV